MTSARAGELRGDVQEVLRQLPVVTARLVADRLGTSVQGAKNLLDLLEGENVVRPAPAGSFRAKRWVAEEVLGVIAD